MELATLGFGYFPTWPREVTNAVNDLAVGELSKPVAMDGKWIVFRVVERRPPTFDEVNDSLSGWTADEAEVDFEGALLKAAEIKEATPVAPDFVFATINDEPINGYDCSGANMSNVLDALSLERFPNALTLRREAESCRQWLRQLTQRDDLYADMDVFRPFLSEQQTTRDNAWDTPWLADHLAIWRTTLLAAELRDVLTQKMIDSGQFQTDEYHGTLARILTADTLDHANALADALPTARR